jgi:hypothetical protein
MNRIAVLNLLVVALTTSSATSSALAEEADFSSPKQTLKTLLGILKEGQLDRVPECFVRPQNEQERNMLLYGLSSDTYVPAVHRALVEKFGEQNSSLGKMLASFDQQLAAVDSMEESIDGANGRLSVKGLDGANLSFVQTKNQWKIALSPSLMLRGVPSEQVAAAQAMRGAYVSTISEIKAGQFSTADRAMQVLNARRRAATTARVPQPKSSPGLR